MNFTNHSAMILVILLPAIIMSVIGYPIINTEENLINKDEKRYPNGTIIGKYTYNDNEGNPIHVKYYADNASYGVELKSMKLVKSNPLGMDKLSKYPLLITEPPYDPVLDPFLSFKDVLNFNRNLTHEPSQSYKNKAKSNMKNNVEFEILLQNEVKAPEKCGKEKVKVYFDKDKRKTRNVDDNYDSMRYCNRF